MMKTLLMLVSLISASSSCPGECRCLWKQSKITVECTGVGARDIPDNIDVGSQVLNMSDNLLQEMTEEMFARRKLLNLQKISVGHNKIIKIHSRTFSDLLNLVDVDLSHNQLSSVPSQSLSQTPSLMILSLSHNPISVIRTNDFSHLEYLTRLDLSHCEIELVESGSLNSLPSLERLYLESNRLRVISDVRQLPGSLHGVSLHDNPWHCDCHLRQLRDWMVRTNVPRLYEPTCHSPSRLSPFKITTVNLQEFACLPTVSPTSMFISVREGKNVSLVCRVKSDPEAEISWSYNGLLIDSYHPRMRMIQQYEGSLGTRSELVISNTSLAENGSFLCLAENKAGKSMSNYSLQVTQTSGDTLVMEMKMEHFIAVSVCIITILLLLMVIVTILLIKIARKHVDSSKSSNNVYKASSMPRSIQMGTGCHVVKSTGCHVKRAAPDILSGVSQSQSSSDGSMVSMETVLTPATSDLTDMRDIIKDLDRDNHSHQQPLIGHNPSNQSPDQSAGQIPSWSIDNPYLHTSSSQAPYLVYRQRLSVRPDEQYPVLNYPQYQSHHHNQLYPQFHHKDVHQTLQQLSSNNLNNFAKQLDQGDKSLVNQVKQKNEKSLDNSKVSEGANNCSGDSRSDNKSGAEAVISDNDTVNEMLSKLRGNPTNNKDDEDSQEISEELENAFPSLDLSGQCWDLSEGTRI